MLKRRDRSPANPTNGTINTISAISDKSNWIANDAVTSISRQLPPVNLLDQIRTAIIGSSFKQSASPSAILPLDHDDPYVKVVDHRIYDWAFEVWRGNAIQDGPEEINNVNCYSRYAIEEDDLTVAIKEAQANLDPAIVKELKGLKGMVKERKYAEGQYLYYLGVLFVPDVGSLCTKALQKHHNNRLVGHPGIKKTLAVLHRHYAWPGDAEDVKKYVSSCEVCLRSKPCRQKQYGPL